MYAQSAAWIQGRIAKGWITNRSSPAMDAAAQHTTFSRSLLAAASLILLAAAPHLGGCSTASTGREAYFASRANTVMFAPGTGESRVSLGPDTPFGNDIGLADASDSAPRALGDNR